MAVSVKISQLAEGNNIQSQDVIPIARDGETYKIPASQIVVAGQSVGVGPGQIFSGKSTGAGSTLQFRSLSGTDGIVVGTQGQTLVITSSGQNPVKTKFFGDGITTTYGIAGTVSSNINNYRVDIDGVLQEPGDDFTINGTNIIFSSAPPSASKVVVVSNNLVRAYDIVPLDGSVTAAKLATDILSAVNFSVQDTSTIDLTRTSNTLLADVRDNSITPQKLSQPPTFATAKAFDWNGAATNTFIEFTNIPSWVKRITVLLANVSTNGTSQKLVQLGNSSGFETTGYLAGTSEYNDFTGLVSTGFPLNGPVANTAAETLHGSIVISNLSGNIWVANGTVYASVRTVPSSVAGSKTLSNTLDRIRVTTAGGANIFDSGIINIMYE